MSTPVTPGDVNWPVLVRVKRRLPEVRKLKRSYRVVRWLNQDDEVIARRGCVERESNADYIQVIRKMRIPKLMAL